MNARPTPRKRSLKTTLILIAAVVAYALLQPRLETWLGVDLPSLTGEEVAQPEAPPAESDAPSPAEDGDRRPAGTSGQTSISDATEDHPDQSIASEATDSKPVPKLGELRDVGDGVFQSTAGLYYRPGSREGHRIKHVLRHHEDDPDRPVHGVFEGDRNELFAIIDEAYLYTFDHGPPQVSKEEDDGRTIYVVDLGRRIGYVGGQRGRRNDHPAAHHVQLILEGTNVITAYPVRRR